MTKYVIVSMTQNEYVEKLHLEGAHDMNAVFTAKAGTVEDATKHGRKFDSMTSACLAIYFIDIQLEQGRNWIPVPVKVADPEQISLAF